MDSLAKALRFWAINIFHIKSTGQAKESETKRKWVDFNQDSRMKSTSGVTEELSQLPVWLPCFDKMDNKILPICCIQKIVLYETKAVMYWAYW